MGGYKTTEKNDLWVPGSQKCPFQFGINDSGYIPSFETTTKVTSRHQNHVSAIITHYKSSL